MVEAPLPFTCRCSKKILIDRKDVPETHKCPGCGVRFTLTHQVMEGVEIVTPRYFDGGAARPAAPAAPAPAAAPRPSPPPAPAPRPAATGNPAVGNAPAKPAAPAAQAPAEVRFTLARMLPPNGAIREYLAVLNEPGDGPDQDAAAAAITKLGTRALPFLSANLMAGQFHAHIRTLQCLRDINDASVVGTVADYARSLRGLGRDDLREEAEKLAGDLIIDGK